MDNMEDKKEDPNNPQTATAFGNNIAQALAPGSIASIVLADFKSPLGIIVLGLLAPYLCITIGVGYVFYDPMLAFYLLLCISPFSIGALIVSAILKNRTAIALSVLIMALQVLAIIARWFFGMQGTGF